MTAAIPDFMSILPIFRPRPTGRSVCSAGRGRAQILGGRPGGAAQGVGGGEAETGETDLAKTNQPNITNGHNFFCVDFNYNQIVRKTELRKEYELVEAEVNKTNNKFELLICLSSQMEIISGIIGQLPNTCPSVDPDHASGRMEN